MSGSLRQNTSNSQWGQADIGKRHQPNVACFYTYKHGNKHKQSYKSHKKKEKNMPQTKLNIEKKRPVCGIMATNKCLYNISFLFQSSGLVCKITTVKLFHTSKIISKILLKTLNQIFWHLFFKKFIKMWQVIEQNIDRYENSLSWHTSQPHCLGPVQCLPSILIEIQSYTTLSNGDVCTATMHSATKWHLKRNQLTKTEHNWEHLQEHSRWQWSPSFWQHLFGSLLKPRQTDRQANISHIFLFI